MPPRELAGAEVAMNEAAPSRWHALAHDKLRAVLGSAKADVVLRQTLSAIGRDQLRSPDDLLSFARALCKAGGFAGAVGGLLSVQAALHGASEPPPAGEIHDDRRP